jgi:hypothetical protein
MEHRNKAAHEQRYRSRRRDDLDRLMSRSVRSLDPLSVDMHITGADDVETAAWTGAVGKRVQLVELPLLLTISRAAEVLAIRPAKAYQLAHRYEATGCEGLPVIRLGRSVRVPRWALLVLACTGRVVTLSALAAHEWEVRRPLNGRRVTISRRPVGRATGAVPRPRSSGGRPVGRVRRLPGPRRAGSFEPLGVRPLG